MHKSFSFSTVVSCSKLNTFIWFHIPFTHNNAAVIWIHSVMQTLAMIYCRKSSGRMYWVISLRLLFSFIAFWHCGAADLYQSLLDSLTLLSQLFLFFTAREYFPIFFFIIIMLAVIEENYSGEKYSCCFFFVLLLV